MCYDYITIRLACIWKRSHVLRVLKIFKQYFPAESLFLLLQIEWSKYAEMIASSLKFQINLDVNALTKFTFSREKIKKNIASRSKSIKLARTRKTSSRNEFFRLFLSSWNNLAVFCTRLNRLVDQVQRPPSRAVAMRENFRFSWFNVELHDAGVDACD